MWVLVHFVCIVSSCCSPVVEAETSQNLLTQKISARGLRKVGFRFGYQKNNHQWGTLLVE